MSDTKQLLLSHFQQHPEMTIQDAIKFLHQSYMGPGHLITDKTAAMDRLKAEWASLPDRSPTDMGTPIGNGLFRLNLNHCKAIKLSTKTMFSMFYETSKQWKPDSRMLDDNLDLIYSLPFPMEQIKQTLQAYRQSGMPMVSHSEQYRNHYSPAYRIVRQEYINLLPILRSIDLLLKEQSFVRVAIDGPCASGKSTLGQMLSQLYQCPLISMDDFFLRPEQRSKARLSEPGGNVDYQRFDQEVLVPLCQHTEFSYRPWSCHLQAFSTPRKIPVSPLTIVEGSYSLRPDLRDRYHLRIWVEATPEIRQERLLKRDGPEMLERFRSVWIPLENHYFSSCCVKECCHLIWNGNN